MSQLLDRALEYAGRGWAVFPVKVGTKVPLTMRGRNDATKDVQTIRSWWLRWPDASIGVATGPESGLAVVDIDPRNGGDEAIAELLNGHLELPPTLKCATGGGGFHLYFNYVPGFKNTAGRYGKGIDTRGDGGYVIAPPSVHPSGKAYAWDNQLPVAAMPDWLTPKNLAELTLAPVQSTRPDADTRCRAYLDKVPDAVSGNGGHGATLRAACECFRFGLTEGQAWTMLNWFNDTKCQPRWSERELRHKLSEGRKKVDQEGKFGMRLEGDNESADWPISFVIEAGPEEESKLRPPAAASFPSELLHPPGTVGDICKWINDAAIKPQPVLTLANTLAFFGAVVGRKVRTPTDLRTNLYCLGVGESGSGKDHSRKAIKRICEAAGLTAQILGGEEVSSDSAILSAVYTRPSILFQFDEIGHFLANANSKYAATHLKNVAPTFTKLFSSANTTAIGKEYSGQDRKDIVQPNVCLYGTTVPGRLYEGLTPGEISDGFLGRMLVFQSNDSDPVEREVITPAVPESIINPVQAWYGRKDLPQAPGNLAALTQHVPITVPFEPEAMNEIRRFRDKCRTAKAVVREQGTGLDVLWSRAVEHACKVALTVACGCEFGTPIVSGQVMRWAIALVEHLVLTLVSTVGESVAGSDFERDLLKVQKCIYAAGHRGIEHSELYRRTRWLRNQSRKEILDHLLTQGTIVLGEKKGARGSAAKVYASK